MRHVDFHLVFPLWILLRKEYAGSSFLGLFEEEPVYNINLPSFNRLGIKKEQPVGAKVLIKEVKG